MPGTVRHALSMTTPDDPAYENRPSHWNQTHALTLSATGSEIIGAFSNANGLSFGLSAGAVTGSHNALTTAALSNHSHGDPQLNLTNLSGTTASNSAGFTLSLSAAAPGGGGLTNIRVSAGTTSNLLSDLTFADANGVTFGLNASTITASHNALTSQSNQNVTAANGGFAFQTLSFSNANNFSFGTSAGSAITGSYTVPTVTNSSWTASDGATSLTIARLAFTNANGLTLTLSTTTGGSATLVGSHNGLTSQSNQAFSADASSTFQTLTFQDSNGLSFSNNAGALRITHALQFTSATSAITSNAMHSTSRPAFSADASSTFQTLTFQNSNGFTFSNNAGAIRASYTVPVQSNGILDVSTATASGTATSRFAMHDHQHRGIRGIAAVGTATTFFGDFNLSGGNGVTLVTGGNSTAGSVGFSVANQSNQQMTFFATGNTTLSSTGTSNASSLIFRGSGAASVGITNGSILIDVAAGAAAITQSIGMSTQTAGGATAGTTGYATGDDVLYHFVPGSNITMSQSVNGASATLSIYGPAAGGGVTYPGFEPYDDFVQVVGQVGQGSLLFDPQPLPNVSFDRFFIFLQNTNSSNSSGSHTLRFSVGLYTRNASTLSLYTSFGGSTAVTHSGTAGSYSWYSGGRGFPITFAATSISENRYWIGFVSSTASGGANGTYSNYLVSKINSQYTGLFGAGSNASMQPRLGQGFYSASTTALPNSVAFTQIQGTNSNARRFPVIGLGSSTI